VAHPSPPPNSLQRARCHLRPSPRLHCNKRLPSFAPLTGPILYQTWETLKNSAADLFSPETATLQAALEPGTLAQAQHSFGHHEAQHAYKAPLRTAKSFSPTAGMLLLSRLRSVACRAASAWLETLPTAPPLRLDDGAFRAALHCRNSESNLPSGSPDAACFCGTCLSATDAEHALTCHSPNALRVLRHDDIMDVVRHMLRRVGVLSTKEPKLPVLHLQGPSSARPPAGARGDLLFSLEGKQWIGDVSIVLPGAATYFAAAAQTDGGAAAHRDDVSIPVLWTRLLPLCAPEGRDLWAPGEAPHEAHHRRRGQCHPAEQRHVHRWRAPQAVRLLVQAERQHRTCCKRVFCASEWRSILARVGASHR
jgi:hypothetical protein